MLLLLIFLLLIFFIVKKPKLESFNTPSLPSLPALPALPNLSDKTLKESLQLLNNHLMSISKSENSITHFYNSIEKFNYFSYNNSPAITVIIPLNSTINQYLSWILTDLTELNQSPNIINNSFILGNIFNQTCSFNSNLSYCGPFDKNKLINRSNQNLQDSDFIIPNIRFQHGIIHIVDFLLENSNNTNLYKNEYFRDFTREERNSHISSINFS